MNGIFLFLARDLGLGSFNDLLRFVVANELYSKTFRFSEEEITHFREFDKRSGLEPLTTDGYKAILPTRLIMVSSYSIILKLWTHLSPAARADFQSVHQYVQLDGSLPPEGHPRLNVGIIDSHFHLDGFSIQYLTTLSDLERSTDSPLPVRLFYAIQNFVFPTRWPKIDRQVVGEPRLRFTLGIHPNALQCACQEEAIVRI